MLPTAKMVAAHRKAIEQFYTMEATIITDTNHLDESTGIVSMSKETRETYPCYLDFGNSSSAGGENVAKFSQYATLYISPNVIVPKGARIDVLGPQGRIFRYKAAGLANVYETHQEIQIENLEVH